IGPSRAMQLILTGQRITADEAHRMGLVDAVVAAGDLMRAAGGLAKTIAANAPLAVRAAKRAIRYGLQNPLQAAFDLEGHLQRMLYASADCQEGIVAFRERRPPRWAGR